MSHRLHRLPSPVCPIVLQLPAALTLALVVFGSGARAQTVDWSRYQAGRSPVGYYEGTTSNGEQWTGRSYTVGHTTYFDAYGPNGQAMHCTSYKLGLSTYADCPLPPVVSATAASAGLHPTKHAATGARRVGADLRGDRHLARNQHRHPNGRGTVAGVGSGAGEVQTASGVAVAGASR